MADFGQEQMQKFSVPSLINRTTNDITQIQMLLAMGTADHDQSAGDGSVGDH